MAVSRGERGTGRTNMAGAHVAGGLSQVTTPLRPPPPTRSDRDVIQCYRLPIVDLNEPLKLNCSPSSYELNFMPTFLFAKH